MEKDPGLACQGVGLMPRRGCCRSRLQCIDRGRGRELHSWSAWRGITELCGSGLRGTSRAWAEPRTGREAWLQVRGDPRAGRVGRCRAGLRGPGTAAVEGAQGWTSRGLQGRTEGHGGG